MAKYIPCLQASETIWSTEWLPNILSVGTPGVNPQQEVFLKPVQDYIYVVACFLDVHLDIAVSEEVTHAGLLELQENLLLFSVMYFGCVALIHWDIVP